MEAVLKNVDKNNSRIASVDEFRGFAIISMIIVNYLAYYNETPWYLKHAKGIGFTAPDLVAPFFIFIIGLVYRSSFLNRVVLNGRIKAWFHIFRRYFFFFALGFLGTWMVEGHMEWGVLQAIGISGLITLLFIELGFWERIMTALIILVIYQWALFPILRENITTALHGGVWASLSWGAMLLLATAAGDLVDINKFWITSKKIAVYGFIFFIVGLITLKFVPISKMEVNTSYVLISTGLSALVFDIFFIVTERFHLIVPALKQLGKNALLIYIAHFLLINFIYLFIPSNANHLSIIFGTIIVCISCYLLAWLFDLKKWYLKF